MMNAIMGGSLFLFPSSSSSLTVSKTTLSSSSSPSMSLISTTARHRRRAPNRSFPRSLVIETVQGQTSDGKDKDKEEEEEEESRSESVSRRRLILLRHANSSWEDRSLRDHDRPLSRTGQSDAIEVSQKLQKLGWIPELILSSDAVRTRETLKIMQEQVKGFLEAEVHFISSFYSIAAMDGQTAEHLQHAICKFSRDEILTVMCMGHNRGWEEAASMFSGASIELKTCNAALLEATGKSWEEVKRFFSPRNSYCQVPLCICPVCYLNMSCGTFRCQSIGAVGEILTGKVASRVSGYYNAVTGLCIVYRFSLDHNNHGSTEPISRCSRTSD